MPGTHVFVISWAGQHPKAEAIVRSLAGSPVRISLVYSDPDPALAIDADCDRIRRPNELFWGDKFRACLDAFDGERLLVIHADCACNDWPDLVARCEAAMTADAAIGSWAPLIQGANLDIRKTHIAAVRNSPLLIVAQTDALVFSLSRPVVERMKAADYGKNVLGWGIDDMAAAHCYSRNLFVVVDRSVLVDHPVGTGYSKEAAEVQKAEFLGQLSLMEAVQHKLLWSCIELNWSRYLAQQRQAAANDG